MDIFIFIILIISNLLVTDLELIGIMIKFIITHYK